MTLFASEATERGEWLPKPPLGEGERERVSYRRGTCMGVEGTEFECCETSEGRCGWARACVPASSRLLPVPGTPFDVIVGALVGTLRFVSLFPSAVSVRAGAGFDGGFLVARRAESRWDGGLREWGDTITAGKGVWAADWCSSSMRASCRKGCSSRYGGAGAECACWKRPGGYEGDQRPVGTCSRKAAHSWGRRLAGWMLAGGCL